MKTIKFDSKELFEKKIEGVVSDWATAWNASPASHPSAKGRAVIGPIEGDVELDAAAQFMRYLCGASSKATFQPLNANVSLKVEGNAEFIVAEAKASAAFYYPRKEGWMWTLPGFLTDKGASAKDIDLGAVRMMLMGELKGAAGCSIAVEGSLSIERKIGQLPLVQGVPAPDFVGPPPLSVPILGAEKKMLVAGANAQLNAFAGIKGGIEIKGAIEWRDPEDEKKSFAAFAAVAPALAGLAGAGFSGKASVQYVDGKFKLELDASGCIGIGAEGKISCEVDFKLLANFIKWFFYQLYHANFAHLEFIQASAFGAARDLTFIALCQFKTIDKLFGIPESGIASAVSLVHNSLEKADVRHKLALNIISDPTALKYAPPETKGMIIYQLCNDDNIDWARSNFGIGNDFLRAQKEAIKHILERWSHTQADCRNVIQHMTVNGKKGDYKANLARLRKFLNEEAPYNRDIPGLDSKHRADFDQWYNKLSATLKEDPTRGFPVVPSDSYQYAFQRDNAGDHPLFSSSGENAFYV